MAERKKKTGHNSNKSSTIPSHACIVKRAGHLEQFDDKKLYASAFAACLNAHLSAKKSESIAQKVLDAVQKEVGKLKRGTCIASSHLSIIVERELAKHDKDAAFLYETHLDLS